MSDRTTTNSCLVIQLIMYQYQLLSDTRVARSILSEFVVLTGDRQVICVVPVPGINAPLTVDYLDSANRSGQTGVDSVCVWSSQQ